MVGQMHEKISHKQTNEQKNYMDDIYENIEWGT